MHPNAYGKAVLAFIGEEDVKQVIPSRLTASPPTPSCCAPSSSSSLSSSRKTGLAYDNEEYTSGIRCIGATVFDVQGKAVAGLGVTCLLSTIDAASKAAFELVVLECAWRVSKDIGYSGDFFVGKVRAAQPDSGLPASGPERPIDSSKILAAHSSSKGDITMVRNLTRFAVVVLGMLFTLSFAAAQSDVEGGKDPALFAPDARVVHQPVRGERVRLLRVHRRQGGGRRG